MEKILELFKSSDPSNHLIALGLIKGLELDLFGIVTKIFHDKDYWAFDNNFNTSELNICKYTLYQCENMLHVYDSSSLLKILDISEAIKYITELLTKPNQ